ncbi:MAG: GNAT family N-acetyltransferase [Candidatus Aenigmarchaeota archaeon]|nr:GNAT family N-acetyltransferase [Candidatus Aenigmarchaeota archaeon]
MIELLQDEERWKHFVRFSNSTIFHTIEWRNVIRDTFGYKPYYIVSTNEGTTNGCFPMFCVKSFIFGKRYISLPFSFAAGPIYTDVKFLKELLTEAKRVSKDSKYLEIRTKDKIPVDIVKEFELNENTDTFMSVLELTDIDTIWKEMDKKHRNAIRKAEKDGLKVREGTENDLRAYHRLKMRLSAKKYGIPSEPLLFYQKMWEEMHKKNLVKLFVAEYEGKIIGGIILLMHKDEILYFSGAADEKYLNVKPYNLLVWEAIKYSLKNRYKYFNFGTSENKGLLDFKESFGAKSVQIPVYSTSELGKAAGYGLFTKIWKRIPTRLSKFVGPFLVRHKGG